VTLSNSDYHDRLRLREYDLVICIAILIFGYVFFDAYDLAVCITILIFGYVIFITYEHSWRDLHRVRVRRAL